MNESQLKEHIKSDIAQSLNLSVDQLPGDLPPKQACKALFNTDKNTLASWRCLQRYDIPYYQLGSGRVFYPLFALIDFKLQLLNGSINEAA